jgi:hypothetical protein
MKNMNKKAQIFEQVMYLPRVIILAALIFIVYALISSGIKNEIKTFDAESELIINRMIYSRSGISYYDENIDRVYPGIIDVKKLSNLNAVFNLPADDVHLSARVTLTQTGKLEPIIHYLNGEWFQRWYPLTSLMGLGGKQYKREQLPVTVFEQGKELVPGILQIEIIIPNE